MWTRPQALCLLAGLCFVLGLPAAASPLVLWHAYRGEERRVLEGLLSQYDAAHPEVEIVTRAVPYDGFVTKLEAAGPRGNGPDLFIAAHERLGDWAPLGLVTPTPATPSGFHPATLDALTHEQRVYGLPLIDTAGPQPKAAL